MLQKKTNLNMKKFILSAFITLCVCLNTSCLNTVKSTEAPYRTISEAELNTTQTNNKNLGVNLRIDLDGDIFLFAIQDVQVKNTDDIYVFGTCKQNIKMIHFYDGNISIPISEKRVHVIPCRGYQAVVEELIKLQN